MDRRLGLGFALLVAVLLVVNPLYTLPNGDQPEYDHSIDRIEQGEIPDGIDVLRYDSLSPAAQGVVDEALVDAEGQATVVGEEHKPPEFAYSDESTPNRGQYVIEQNGTFYELWTSAGGGLFGVADLIQQLLQVLGVGVTLAAIGMREPPRFPAAAAGVAAVPLLLLGVGIYDDVELLVLLATLGSFVVIGALAVGVDTAVSRGTAAVAILAMLVGLAVTGGGLFILLPVTMLALGLVLGGLLVVVSDWVHASRGNQKR